MLHRICSVIVLIFIAFLSVSGCTVHKTPVGPPVITLKTETYVVVQTAPDKFTVLTRSKAAMGKSRSALAAPSSMFAQTNTMAKSGLFNASNSSTAERVEINVLRRRSTCVFARTADLIPAKIPSGY